MSILLEFNGLHSDVLSLPQWWQIPQRECERSQLGEMVPSAGGAGTLLGIVPLKHALKLNPAHLELGCKLAWEWTSGKKPAFLSQGSITTSKSCGFTRAVTNISCVTIETTKICLFIEDGLLKSRFLKWFISIIVKWVLTGSCFKGKLVFGSGCETLFVLVGMEFSIL